MQCAARGRESRRTTRAPGATRRSTATAGPTHIITTLGGISRRSVTCAHPRRVPGRCPAPAKASSRCSLARVRSSVAAAPLPRNTRPAGLYLDHNRQDRLQERYTEAVPILHSPITFLSNVYIFLHSSRFFSPFQFSHFPIWRQRVSHLFVKAKLQSYFCSSFSLP